MKKTRDEKIADIIFGVYGKEIKQKKLNKMGIAKDEMSRIVRKYQRVVKKVLRGKKIANKPETIDSNFGDLGIALKDLSLKDDMRRLYLEMADDPFTDGLNEISKEIADVSKTQIEENVKELKIYLNKNKKKAPKWANYAVRREDGSWFWKASKDEDSKKEWTGYEDRGNNGVVTVHINNFKEDVNEANIEIKDKNASSITVDGKPYLGKLGGLKADYPKHFAALRNQLKKDGKTLSNFGGDDPRVDIVAKADGTISVNYDA